MLRQYQTKLHWRIALLFLGFSVLLFSTALLVVNHQNLKNARATIEQDLRQTAEVFSQLVAFETQSLQDLAKPATSDHAFRQVFNQGHTPTLVSAMRNLVARIENIEDGVMMLVDFDLSYIASTRDHQTAEFEWPYIIERAETDDQLEAAGLGLMSGQLFQLVVSPMLIPDPEAWVVIGFPIDSDFASTIANTGLAQISVYSVATDNAIALHASSFTNTDQEALNTAISGSQYQIDQAVEHQMLGERFLTLSIPLDRSDSSSFMLAVHGSLDEAMAPYRQLQLALIAVFVVGLLASMAGIYRISRSITQPIEDLNTVVSRIGDGDFQARASTARQDEIGSLAITVNRMASGLEEKQRIRNLLGRVVSDEIAEELLSKDIKLGGELRSVSVLFVDIRNFTGLSEQMSPAVLVNLLNRYFELVATIIESHRGVVDKYIGDEVMAVFGAPIESNTHANDAVISGMEILDQLNAFNARIQEEMGISLEVGIGISSGEVVAGNLGSKNRMNYTLIGDTVNVASRLESLTKKLGWPLIVSESTQQQSKPQSLKDLALKDLVWKDLGEVSIRGKDMPLQIFGYRPTS